MYQSKLWLVGMTQNKINDFKEIVQYSDKYFDGLIYVDHFSKDGTYELLESHKGNGKIIQRSYYKQHSHSQNEILFCRHAKNGDWMFLNDSSERIQLKWLETIRNDIQEYEKDKEQEISAIYFSNRVYLWRYFDFQAFYGSPHWTIFPIYGTSISFGEDNKYLYIQNNRENNKPEHYCVHPIVYWFCHSPSNQVLADYGKYGQEIVDSHEQTRQQFRIYCEKILNLSLDSLDDLINYMIKIKNKETIPNEYFIYIVEKEYRLSELFQLKVLNQDFMNVIAKNRYKFSFLNYLKFGDGFVDKNYCGTILIYNEKFNIKN